MLRKIFTLLAVFVVFYLGAHFYLRRKNRVEVDTIKTTKLIDCGPNQVRGLRIVRKGDGGEETLKFTRRDPPEAGLPPAAQLAKAVWQQEAPRAGEADAAMLNRLAAAACETYDPIPQRPQDMAGAATPRLEIEVENQGRTELHAIEFGPVGQDRQSIVRYRAASGERVVKISPQLRQLVSQPSEKFVNVRVLRMSANDVQVLAAAFDGRERFVLERAGADWRLLVNGAEARGAEDPDRYVNRLSTLRAQGVRPGRGGDCEKRSHKVTLRLQGLAGKKELVGFDFGKSGLVTACDSARDAVFEVHRDMLKYLDLTATEK